ncbi:GNAT family N-acetyltransferase [Roseococcus pinisoli]|uniref:GNAT family N-acetyltransferase n=1 Tax=Roseococcus pinisoli TaxID=2835040 RepID=A0ABS5QIP8_9PROT|nr:GNAT family N-acetyltransferase [Roseococcus pinisoli]
MIAVQEESPRQEAVADLLRQSDAVAARLYPDMPRRALNPETVGAPGIRLLMARLEGAAAGCCLLLDHEEGIAELKRMIVGEGFRGRGVGIALLHGAEAAARASGIRALRLEVGIRNTEGQALYRRAGYGERGPFGTYRPSPISLFLGKTLA